MVEISAILLKSDELSTKVDAVKAARQGRPDPSGPTKDKVRWLQGTVINCTQFKLAVRSGPHFDSGRYETNPSDVGAWGIGQFTVVNKNGSVMTGATGSNGWDLQLQSGIDVNLSFGWTAPWNGAHKSAVVESITTRDAYDKAVENGNSVTSKKEYQGVDKDGNPVSIKFRIACDGGQRPTYTVTQQIV